VGLEEHLLTVLSRRSEWWNCGPRLVFEQLVKGPGQALVQSDAWSRVTVTSLLTSLPPRPHYQRPGIPSSQVGKTEPLANIFVSFFIAAGFQLFLLLLLLFRGVFLRFRPTSAEWLRPSAESCFSKIRCTVNHQSVIRVILFLTIHMLLIYIYIYILVGKFYRILFPIPFKTADIFFKIIF